MRGFILLIILGLSWCVRAQQPFEGIAEQEMKMHQNDAKSLTSEVVGNSNIIYDRLEFIVDPAINHITGKVTTVFIPDTVISFMEFDLSDTLTTDSIIYHGQTLSFTHYNDVLHVTFLNTLPQGQADSVAIYYHGAPDSTGFGSFVKSTHDSVPIIWTLSEPYGARDWWPCKQDLQDKIDSVDIYITTPSAYQAASNGILVEQITTGPRTTYHWKHRYPIATYLVCMAITNYTVFTDLAFFNGDTLKILNYVYPENFAADTAASKLTVAAMQLYDSIFGAYPFSKEKYGQVEFGWGGGMEHQTMTFMHDYGFEVVVHELAHHWFGDKVTCHSWHDIWLNEGFAVYLTTLCYQHFNQSYYLASKKGCIGSAIQEPNGSVWCDDTTSVARIFNSHLSYAKGAVVLHQLNWILGDSVFFTALRNYLTDTTNAYAFGTTISLQRHLEQTSGLDLTNYFQQYVYGKGFPSFQIQWSQDLSHQVSLTIRQTQSDPSVPFFQIPVPVQFKGLNGSDDTLMIFNLVSSGQSFSFTLPFLADSLLFDPNFDILSANNVITGQSGTYPSCLIYPNPVSGTLQFRVQSSLGGSAEIKIYDMQGRMVYSEPRILHTALDFLSIDVSTLQAGLYELEVVIGKNSSTTSLSIENRK